MALTLVKLAAFAAAIIVLSVIVIQSITTPVPGRKVSYTALITDVSGLYSGDSVRRAGVEIGKVEAVDLKGGLAHVRFDVQADQPVSDTTQVAVRYQNLVGQRYLEVIASESDPGTRLRPGQMIGVADTIPSFDITGLFNSVAPLLTPLSAAELNQFGENILKVVQGDGTGLQPVLDAINKVMSYVGDRDNLIATLIDALGQVSGQLVGHSATLMQLISNLDGVFSNFTDKADNVNSSIDQINRAMGPAVSLLEQIQGSYDGNYGPLDGLLHRVVPATPQIVQVLATVPGLLSAMNNAIPGTNAAAQLHCSRGRVGAPILDTLMIGGKNLVLCRQ